MTSVFHFASESVDAPTGIATFGIDWRLLLMQAITFLLLVLVLKKFVLGKLYTIIDERRSEIEKGLDASAEARKELMTVQEKVEEVLQKANNDAQDIISNAKKEAADILHSAEEKATQQAAHIVHDAQQKLSGDIEQVKKELVHDAAMLVRSVSETVLREKLNDSKDMEYITAELERRHGA